MISKNILIDSMKDKIITGDNFYLQGTNTVLDVIGMIDESGFQICFIVDEHKCLIGSISDGDIRRGLINGLTTQSHASEVMEKSPISILFDRDEIDARRIMEDNDIKQLPVVNQDNRLVGLYLWDEIVKIQERPNTILIMAGGFGKRMMPLTENLPKPMLQVRGKPILEHIILNAKEQGFNNFIISVYYLAESITQYFGDGSQFNVSISYLTEEEPLGTAGCLSLIHPRPELPLLVTNGDIVTEVNYAHLLDFHLANSSDATMAIKKYELQNPYGVVNTDGLNISSFEEKPIQISYVNSGIYAINPSVIEHLDVNTFCDMPDFFMDLKSRQYQIMAYPIHETWTDVGRPKDLHDINGSELNS
jgi:dTDP-glucose pyrophosphorylase/predicted transcriptional regulator|tara:strand:+ start:1312 stop:2397 length:1086 start_codon:yes stop_codon:yes gene_type:complete